MCVVLALLACKALSSSDDTSKPAASAAAPAVDAAPPPSMTGVYDGTFTRDSGQAGRVVGIVTASGDARFVADGDVQNVGKLTLTGTKVAGTLQSFAKGVAGETVTLDGVLVPERSIAGTFKAPSGNGKFLLTFSTAHHKPGNLKDLEGTWKAGTFRMTVDATGAYTARDATACRYAGSFALADPKLAAYSFDLTLTQCGRYDGSYDGHAVLSGGKLAYGVSGARFARAGHLTR